MNGFTAAHRTLPLNSFVRVVNLATGQSVVVWISDRGPNAPGRIIDLSAKAARDLGMTEDGAARVRIDLLNASEAKL
jgi:peptidoglycan lytic transglycosylase